MPTNLCARIQKDSSAGTERRGERERLEWNEEREKERGKIIKRESAKNDLPATRWNNFPANTVATFKRHCMHRFLRRNGENEAETKRERRERKSSIYFRGKKEEEKAKERKIFFPFRENLCSFLAPVYGIYVCKFEKRRKKKWNDKFRFRSNDHPNELSSAIITANITV